MAAFDRYVMVDWSASATPTTGRDSIWIGDLVAGGEVRLSNPSTRAAAWHELDDIVDAGERLLIGIDVALGYPAGTSRLLGLDGEPWRAMWRAIAARSSDDGRNRNNRFDVAADLNRRAADVDGPFWGCPDDRHAPVLRRTKPSASAVAEFRAVERRLRAQGEHPKSCWQLLGAGSVGGQSLTAIPGLDARLERLEVWPFTTGLRRPTSGRAVVAEIWPSRFVSEAPVGTIRDAAQVTGTARAIAAADASGALDEWFEPEVDDPAVVAEEGWILGVL